MKKQAIILAISCLVVIGVIAFGIFEWNKLFDGLSIVSKVQVGNNINKDTNTYNTKLNELNQKENNLSKIEDLTKKPKK
ncbi:hypothetical protein [uncultured Clostridium sp.]|uniref:hypothetical protein n=1 Tax=uncultured Clostridium sp. TaxID=59620 RepID=UPI00258980C9|nr:hypothetical protein [uncultured Clostridium sp.]